MERGSAAIVGGFEKSRILLEELPQTDLIVQVHGIVDGVLRAGCVQDLEDICCPVGLRRTYRAESILCAPIMNICLMGKQKADQVRATGAKYLVAPCANCKKQLKEVCEDHGLDEVEVVGLHDLLLKVIDFEAAGVPRVAGGDDDDEAAETSES